MKMYDFMVKPEWRTLDLIEHTEGTFHVTVIKRRGAQPPQLVCQRLGPDQLLMVYTSPRKMCALAEGVAQAIAIHYNEKIEIKHEPCMLNGSPKCEIIFKKVSTY